jgi:drug/metabolite transporter (DMT)-like permease
MTSPANGTREWMLRASPALFVLIWSTGWISAGYAAPYADPLTFLLIRHVLAAIALALIVAALGITWPKRPRAILHAFVAGALVNGFYLAGVWWAIRHGVPAGLSGVIAALQPILTAALAPLFVKERISPAQWAGIALGFAGLCIAFWPRVAGLDGTAIAAALGPIAINALAMLAVTLGSFYQKRFVIEGELMPMTALQFVGAALVTAPLALLLEPLRIAWNATVALTMAWSVLVLSIGGVCLFLLLIRRGAVSRAAAFIYLVPPVTAAMAFVAFDERLSAIQTAGLVLTVGGVWVATRERAAPPA